MNENLHNIDDLFKKAIDEHEDTPSPAVWDAIDKNLDKKKVISISRKYNKLKWAAAVLLLFTSGMAMYVWQTRMKNKELVKENNINKSSKSNKENKNHDENTSTFPGIKTPTENNNEKEKERVNTETATKFPEQTKQQLNLSQQKINLQQEEKTETEVLAGKDEKRSGKTIPAEKELQSKNTGTVPAEKEETNKSKESFTAGNYFAAIPLLFNNPLLYNSAQQIPSANSFVYKPGALLADNSSVTEKNNKSRSSKTKPARPANNSKLSATVFYSPEFVSTNVKDDHPRFREDNRHEIKNSENQRSASTYGVLLNYNTGSKWALQSGVSIFTRVTDITPKTIYARPDNGGNINYRLSCSAGSAYVPLKSGATPAQGDSTKILSAKNTLQYVSIPATVKYTIGKGKLNLVAGAGIAANILSKGKVETVIAAGSGNESSTNNIEGLKSGYFNSQVSLGAQYHLSKKIAIDFTPTAKLALSSINKNAPVKTKLNAFGLSAGVTIKW